MKTFALACCLLACTLTRAQYADEFNSKIKIGGGYAHDFPGLNGYSVFAEYSRWLSGSLQGAAGIKLHNMSGYPRTQTVQEYTKGASLDFILYYVPLATEVSQMRLGAGYSFSFYNTRRSYPVITNHANGAITNWPLQDKKGRTSGVSLTGEYEYSIPGTNYSVGARASLFKVYDHVTFVGVFAGIAL